MKAIAGLPLGSGVRPRHPLRFTGLRGDVPIAYPEFYDGSARTDGNCSERELRGGSWFTNPTYVRADYRNHFAADYRTNTVGIRLVRDIENSNVDR